VVLAEVIVFGKANEITKLESSHDELQDIIRKPRKSKVPDVDPAHLVEQVDTRKENCWHKTFSIHAPWLDPVL